MNKFKILIFSFLAISLIACSNETTKEPCLYGEPTPILEKNTEGVSEYTFASSDSSGTESALLTDSLLSEGQIRFTMNQSGCNKVKQVFTFELPQNDYSTQADSFFVQRAAEGLMVLSQKSSTASQSFIPMFAVELNAFAAGVTLNKPLAVDSKNAPGVFFVITKIATQNEGIITVEFLTVDG
ncbi:MAG: hypothetical protein AB8G11_13660 [Saprospiraceae bacterium]